MRELVIATNPDPDSRLPYVIGVPYGAGLVFRAGDTWPRTKAVYCFPLADWPADAEIVERVPVRSCVRRGAAIHLVSSVLSGNLKFQLGDLAAMPRSAVVVEDGETGQLAEEWTYRFLAAAYAAEIDRDETSPRMAAAERPAASSAIRACAMARGLDVAPRGRLAGEVVSAYHAAHAP